MNYEPNADVAQVVGQARSAWQLLRFYHTGQ